MFLAKLYAVLALLSASESFSDAYAGATVVNV